MQEAIEYVKKPLRYNRKFKQMSFVKILIFWIKNVNTRAFQVPGISGTRMQTIVFKKSWNWELFFKKKNQFSVDCILNSEFQGLQYSIACILTKTFQNIQVTYIWFQNFKNFARLDYKHVCFEIFKVFCFNYCLRLSWFLKESVACILESEV